VSVLDREVRAVQNPALGAILLWRFAVGFRLGNVRSQTAPLPLVFVVLPVLLDADMSDVLEGTRSGLRAFVAKFSEAQRSKTDMVLAIQNRASALRELTATSLRIALASGLVSIDASTAGIFPTSTTFPKVGIPESVRPLLRSSEKFGKWLGGMTLYEAGLTLKVSF
jgi:hypothetical protein